MAAADGSVQSVLDRVATAVAEIGRKITENRDHENAVRQLNACKLNMQRISAFIATDVFHTVDAAIDEMLQLARQGDHLSSNVNIPASPPSNVPQQQGRGRPKMDVTDDQMQSLFRQGFTAKAMAEYFGCSASYVYTRLHNMGLRIRERYSDISDSDLQECVAELQNQFPNCGTEMLSGYLRLRGLHVQRARVRSALAASNPAASAARWSQTVARRSYRVASPNSLWHIDSHLKLVRWGLYTHAGIDGFSRVIVYLRCSATNRAEEVLDGFATACVSYGLPSRVRCDHGGENVLVGVLMNLLRGSQRGSFITGPSVHNQRIERLWKDVHKEVTQPFYMKFYDMEDGGKLRADDELHRFALQTVFLPVINEKLTSFATAWNMHRIRTAHSKTPNQLWVEGMLHAVESGPETVAAELSNSSNDLLQRLTSRLIEIGVDTTAFGSVAHTNPVRGSLFLTSEQQQELQLTLDSISDVDVKFDTCIRKLTEFGCGSSDA